jgi:hypothetical protein
MEQSKRVHEADTVIEDDGIVTLDGVPVRAGQRVHVIVLMPPEVQRAERYPLRYRKPFRYDQPNEPVGEDDWGGTE